MTSLGRRRCSLFLLAALSSSPLCLADGLPGRALEFDGIDDRVRIPLTPDLEGSEHFTLEAWVHASNVNSGGIAGMWGSGGLPDRFLIDFSAGQVVARVATAAGQASVSAPAPFMTWFHVAAVFNGADLRLYLDGNLVAVTPHAGVLLPAGNDLVFGVENVGVVEDFFRGTLDELRLWKSARSSAEIFQYHNQRVDENSDGLLGMWMFQEAAADQTVNDSTSLAHQGTLGRDGLADVDDPVRVISTAPVRWDDEGHALGGDLGRPRFRGLGSLVGGTMVHFHLDNARPNAPCVLIVGANPMFAPFRGGIMVPTPDNLFFGMTDPAGERSASVLWPERIPACTNLYLQFWIRDSSGPQGWTASNALRIETP